jgi:hypothetical protein
MTVARARWRAQNGVSHKPDPVTGRRSLGLAMLPFFADLVTATDEDRRAFENHPVLLDAVAQGMSVERYRALLLGAVPRGVALQPGVRRGGQPHGRPGARALQPIRHFLYEHMHEETGHETWVLNDLQAIGVDAGRQRKRTHPASTRWRSTATTTGPPTAATPARRWACSTRWRSSPRSTAGRFPRPSASRLLAGRRAGRVLHRIARHDGRQAHGRPARGAQSRQGRGFARRGVESTRVNFHHFTRIIEAI